MPSFRDQRGAAPVLLLVAAVALVAFVIGSSALSFNKGLFGFLFHKDPSHGAGLVALTLVPSQIGVAPNDTFSVDIRADAGTSPLTGAQLSLRWDPAKIKATAITRGNFLKGEFAAPIMDNTAGGALYTLNLGITCTNPLDPNTCVPNPAPTGQGILASIKFQALATTTTPSNITFDAATTIVTSTVSPDNVVGSLNPSAVTIAVDNTPKTAVLSLIPATANVNLNGDLAVTVRAQSDTDSANLFAAKLNFDATKFSVTSIDTSTTGIAPNPLWFSDSTFPITSGKVSVIAGLSGSGMKTTGAVNVAVVHFKALAAGTGIISLDGTSAVYRASDNANILQSPASSVTATISNVAASPTPTPAATPTPAPTATPVPTATPKPTTPGATATPSPVPTATPAATATPGPTPTPPPVACSITGATWDTTVNPAPQGNLVTMTVQGTAGCVGKTVNFEVRKNEVLGSSTTTPNPLDATFSSSNVAIGNWVSQYSPAGPFGIFDPPSYFFNATVAGSSATTFKSTGTDIKISKVPAGTFLQGDANKNGIVDLQDLSVMLSAFGKTTSNTNLFPYNADIAPAIPDGVINAFDTATLIQILRSLGVV